jgi:hypothetical protein
MSDTLEIIKYIDYMLSSGSYSADGAEALQILRERLKAKHIENDKLEILKSLPSQEPRQVIFKDGFFWMKSLFIDPEWKIMNKEWAMISCDDDYTKIDSERFYRAFVGNYKGLSPGEFRCHRRREELKAKAEAKKQEAENEPRD